MIYYVYMYEAYLGVRYSMLRIGLVESLRSKCEVLQDLFYQVQPPRESKSSCSPV